MTQQPWGEPQQQQPVQPGNSIVPAYPSYQQQGYQQPGYRQQGYQQPGYQQPGYQQYPAGPMMPPVVMVAPPKSTGVAYLLWFFLGGIGIHQFYLGRNGHGAAYLVLWLVTVLTFWFGLGLVSLAGIWIALLVDLFCIPGFTRDANARLLGYRY